MSTELGPRWSSSPWPFIIAVLGLSWLAWAPIVLGGGEAQALPWVVLWLLGGFAPSLLALAFTAAAEGRPGVRRLRRRATSIRAGAIWYLPILLLFPAVHVVATLWHGARGDALPQSQLLPLIAANPLLVLPVAVGLVLLGPVSEELGWRGYALDRLQARWSALFSSLVLGVIWGLWHVPLFLMAGTSQEATPLWPFLLSAVISSVLYTWLCNNTGRSILTAILLHTSQNASFALWPWPLTAFPLHLVLLALIAVVVTIVWGPATLSRVRQSR